MPNKTRKNHKNNPKNRSGKKNKKNRKRNDQIKLRGGAAAAGDVVAPFHEKAAEREAAKLGAAASADAASERERGVSETQTKARRMARAVVKKATRSGTSMALATGAAMKKAISSGASAKNKKGEEAEEAAWAEEALAKAEAERRAAEEEEAALAGEEANGVTASVVIVIPVDGDKDMYLSKDDFQCANVDGSGSITLIDCDEAGKPQYYYKQIDINNTKIDDLINEIMKFSNSEVTGESQSNRSVDVGAGTAANAPQSEPNMVDVHTW